MSQTVLLFADSDSQIFGALNHAQTFQSRGWTVRFAIQDKADIPTQLYDRVSEQYEIFHASLQELPKILTFEDVDVVGVFSKASKLNEFLRDFEAVFKLKGGKRPGAFTGYNGLSYEKFEEGLAWRLGFDVIALNGPRDKALFTDFVGYGPWKEQPTVITGLVQANEIIDDKEESFKKTESNACKTFVFAEQVVVPSSLAERRYLMSQLIRIAKKNSEWDVVIKCRVKSHEKTFHTTKFHMQDIKKEFRNLPKNLSISYEPLPSLLKKTDVFATLSSTALFEALGEGVPSFVISDYAVKNSFGSHVFFGAGLPISLANIEDLGEMRSYRLNEKWLEWVGAKNVASGVLADFFEGKKFDSRSYQNHYMTEQRIAVWTKAKKKFNVSSNIRYVLRLFGIYPKSSN